MNNLQCIYDSRQSFYGKAVTVREDNGIALYSYQTKVAFINGNRLTLFDDWDYSNTTLRHVKEFIRQYLPGSNKSLTKRDVIKLASNVDK